MAALRIQDVFFLRYIQHQRALKEGVLLEKFVLLRFAVYKPSLCMVLLYFKAFCLF